MLVMPLASQSWGTLHPSAYRHAAEPARSVIGELRPRGAIRYRCPVTGSYVLLTDPAILAGFAEHATRTRCADCGEMHLLMRMAPVPAIVAEQPKP
jgi:hypothetical protein